MCCSVQVNGDSGNDIELFEVPGVRGCVVANAHAELREYATAAIAAGRSNIHIASQPCAGGIVETLIKFGSIPAPEQPGARLRGMVVQLGMLQSNALAGNLSLLAEPGATWVTPAGRVVPVVQSMGEPADAAAAGMTWVDGLHARPLLPEDGAADGTAPAAAATSAEAATTASDAEEDVRPGELLVVTYQLWSFKGQQRDSNRVRLCTAMVRAQQPATADGFKLLHLHEGVMAMEYTATAMFAALAERTD